MSLDPRQLRAFLAVVETGSLGRAAESLHLSEPAVSRIIKRLETQLDVQLFERRTTGMELTSFGQALLPHANLLSAGADEAVAEIDALRGLDRGLLRIGSVASAAVMVLPAAVDLLLELWPGLRVQVTEAVEDKLLAALASNAIDVALTAAMSDSSDVVRITEHGFHDRYSVIASARHPLVGRTGLSVNDLQDQEWIMPPPDATPRKLFNELLERLGVTWRPVMRVETRSPAAIKAMVASTRFLGWLPEPLFAAEQAAGSLVPIRVRDLELQRRFFVYRRRQSFIPPPVSRFLEILRELHAKP